MKGSKKIRGRLEEAQMKREGFERQMDLIKTQREYEALDKEIKDSTEKEQN
jgi:predicted  nucleic acid-binding Zn-ribbon protein